MSEHELKKNAEGYNDPTAYKAIKNAIGARMEIYRGDIFYIEDKFKTEGSEQRPGRPALVVSNNAGNYHSDNVSVVWLTTADKKPMPTHVEVMCKVPSTALCETVITISKERLGGFIKAATDEEMEAVDKALAVALGLNAPDYLVPSSDNAEIAELRCALEETARIGDHYKAECDKLLKELENVPVFPESAEVQIARLEARCDLYKELYEQAIEKLIG